MNINVWYPEGFIVDAIAQEEWDGVVIRGLLVTKVELNANSAYNFIGLTDYAYGTDVFSVYNNGLCIGTTGIEQKVVVIMPYKTDTRHMQIYACDYIPVGTTFYFHYKMYFNKSYISYKI